jgi:hypothetical protein
MAETKVFDRADLLNIFDASKEHGDRIGTFRSKTMAGDLPPTPVYEMHTVYATTSASFSEKNLWLIVERDVWITNAGLYRLPSGHAYRAEGFGRLTIERGLCNSAEIMRKVMEMAREWEKIVKADCPSGIIGEDPTVIGEDPLSQEDFGDAIRAQAVREGMIVDADGVIHMDENTTLTPKAKIRKEKKA